MLKREIVLRPDEFFIMYPSPVKGEMVNGGKYSGSGRPAGSKAVAL